MEIINRKVKHEYEILEDYVAGIVLQGSEVKSIRSGNVNLGEAYCYIKDGEVWMINSHISTYDSDKFTNHDPLRIRKLLLNKKEIRKINEKLQIQGITLIPLKMFINNKGLIKVLIGVCKGKHNYDKRNDIKDKDNKRELDRIMKSY